MSENLIENILRFVMRNNVGQVKSLLEVLKSSLQNILFVFRKLEKCVATLNPSLSMFYLNFQLLKSILFCVGTSTIKQFFRP